MKKQYNFMTVIVSLATSVIAQLFLCAGVYATDTGTVTTATKKLYYDALSGCVSSDNYRSYRYTELLGITINGPYVRHSSISGDLFLTGFGDSAWSKNLIPGYSLIVRENETFNDNMPKSAFIEREVAGEYDDGKIYCGENENALMQKALEKLNLTIMDVVCDPSDGYKGYGVLNASSTGVACQDEKEEFLLNKSSDSQRQHLEKVVKMKSFPDGLPGGSFALTRREKYYVYKDAFLTACATGNGYDTGSDDMYKINFYDTETGTINTKYYSRNLDPKTKIYVYGGKEESCQSIVDTVNSTVDSMQNSDLGEDIKNCLSQSNDNKTELENNAKKISDIYNQANNMVGVIEKILSKSITTLNDSQLIYYGPEIIKNAESIGGTGSVMEFARRADELETRAIGYISSVALGKATEEQRNELADALEDFKETKLSVYKGEIVDKVESIKKTLPTYRLGDMQDRGGKWRQSVEGVYETNSKGEFICLAFNNINDKADEINNIADMTISFSPYVPVDRKEIVDAERDEQLSADPSPCYDGAGVLGWLVCPALQTLTSVANNTYQNVEKDYLQIDAQGRLLTDNGAAHKAWKLIRNIANIVFTIFLLVVIFSQLTGVGIDNYGIKRVLPRLIIAAILVNASWYICKIAVDLSNIIGLGIKGLLTSNLAQINIDASNVSSSALADGSAWAIELPAGIIGLGALLFTNPGIILAILLGVLSVVVAILFLWFILVAREVAVIVAVILAPLAFVCYILPNTEKLFKRWVSLVKALLLLYPICSLAVGGGQLVGSILAQAAGGTPVSLLSMDSFASIVGNITGIFAAGDTNTGLRLAAMVVQVLPYFFIPTLLKSSLAGLGNIGAKISGLGRGLRSKSTGAIKKSGAYQNAQDASRRRATRLRAGLDKDGKVSTGKWAKLSRIAAGGVGSRSVARARAQYLKDSNEQNRNQLLSDPEYMKAAISAQDSAMNKEKLEAEMSNMKADTGNYAPAAMKQQLRSIMRGEQGVLTDASGNITAAGLRARALMKKMSTSGGLSQKDMTSIFSKAEKGEISSDNLKFAAKFMQSDADVHRAMASKDTATTQYLRDINSNAYAGIGFTDAATGEAVDISQMTRGEWVSSHLAEDGVMRSGNDNLDFVNNVVVDKDEDLVRQSDGVVEESLNRLATTNDGMARIRGIYDNKMLFDTLTTDTKKTIRNKLGISESAPASDTMREVNRILETPTTTPTPAPRSRSFMYEGRLVTPGENGAPANITDPETYGEFIREQKAKAVEEAKRNQNQP